MEGSHSELRWVAMLDGNQGCGAQSATDTDAAARCVRTQPWAMWKDSLCLQLWLSYGTGVGWAAFLHPAAATNRTPCPTMAHGSVVKREG
jgi:hypothetical protein